MYVNLKLLERKMFTYCNKYNCMFLTYMLHKVNVI